MPCQATLQKQPEHSLLPAQRSRGFRFLGCRLANVAPARQGFWALRLKIKSGKPLGRQRNIPVSLCIFNSAKCREIFPRPRPKPQKGLLKATGPGWRACGRPGLPHGFSNTQREITFWVGFLSSICAQFSQYATGKSRTGHPVSSRGMPSNCRKCNYIAAKTLEPVPLGASDTSGGSCFSNFPPRLATNGSRGTHVGRDGMALAPPKTPRPAKIGASCRNHTLPYRAAIGSCYLEYHDDLGD